MFRSIRSRIVIPFVVLVLVLMGALAVYLTARVRVEQRGDLEAQLAAEARLLAAEVEPLLSSGADAAALDAAAKRWGTLVGARVTIIAADGRVLGESVADRATMDNHRSRPEVQQALNGRLGSSTRLSQTLDEEALYVAAPIGLEDQPLGVLRLSLPLEEIERNVTTLQGTILTATILATVVASGLALLIAERTVRPVRRLTHIVQRTAAGDLSARILPTTQDEVGELTRAFSHMSRQLRQQITAQQEESARLGAMMSNLADGVLITDGDGRVQLINPAALRLLETTEADAIGRSFAEVAHHYQLIQLWRRAREEDEEQTEAVEMDRRGRFWQSIITPFWEGDRRSYLVILQDLTQLRRLESARRDFVSNISHELRTPLASLKAVIETLQDGALDNPPVAEHFLARAEVEVDALTQMVYELLELSRIESGRVPLRLSPTAVSDIILPPLKRMGEQAARADLRLIVDLAPNLPAVLADGPRVQQVVSNLVHNAIKFTPPGGEIVVKASLSESADGGPTAVVVKVHDNGVGIPAGDLPRIFERFYKADRARSGGGTGLGLAIAKHIVQAHGGQVTAKSKEGKGSTFTFSLPLAG